jgi:hypothetical protein
MEVSVPFSSKLSCKTEEINCVDLLNKSSCLLGVISSEAISMTRVSSLIFAYVSIIAIVVYVAFGLLSMVANI